MLFVGRLPTDAESLGHLGPAPPLCDGVVDRIALEPIGKAAQSDDGRIEVSLQDGAREGSVQRFVSRTGSVTLNVSDKLDAEVSMSTSHQFATDYSLTVRHLDGQEPNKTATATVGAPKPGAHAARIEMRSLVNEVRLQRRGVFIDPE